MQERSSAFCAFAVMSNHYHLVVYVDQARSRELSREQVVERWTQLFRAPRVVERWCNGKASQTERMLASSSSTNGLQLHAKALGQAWVRGLRKAELLYR